MTTQTSDRRVWKPNPGPQEEALRHQEFEILYGGARGGGKDILSTTPVLTPSGWKQAKDITLKDKLVTPSGEYTKILGIFPKKDREMYQITFIDGRQIICDTEHNWSVYSKSHGHRDGWLVRKTKQLLNKPTEWSIPLITQSPGKLWTGVDPYVLGYILGDGTLVSDKEIIYTVDQETITYLENKGWSSHDYPYMRTIMCNPKGDEAHQYQNVLGRVSGKDKFIPDCLLNSDNDTRLAVLQGLMDSDGHCDKEGRASFCNRSLRLCEGLVYLVRSLGGKAKIAQSSRGIRSVGGYETDGECYKVSVSYIGRFKPFRLTRKATRLHMEQKEDKLGIISIKRVTNGDGVCFAVEDISHQFVIDNFVVTHNTDAGLVWLLDLKEEPEARALVLRRNAEDLADWVDRAGRMYLSQGAIKTGSPGVFKFPSGYTIRTGHLKDDEAYSKYQGHEYQRLLIEELTQIPTEKRYKDLLSSCRSTIDGIAPKVFLTTNPGGPGHSWVKARFKIGLNPEGVSFRDEETGLSRIFIPAKVEDNPVLTEKDPNYVKLLEGYKSSDPERYKAWRKGDWDVFIGQYFDTWQETLSVIPRDYEVGFGRAISGYDYGYGAPASFHRGVVDQDGRVWITHEYYQSQREADQQGEDIVSILGGDSAGMTYCDPSVFSTRAVSSTKRSTDAKFVSDMLAQAGLNVTQANNNRISGWSIVRRYMGLSTACAYHRELGIQTCPLIHVKENCANLIRTIPEQVYDEHNKEDLDTTAEDHALDSLRYLLVHTPEKAKDLPTRTFNRGDEVTGYGGSYTPQTRTFNRGL